MPVCDHCGEQCNPSFYCSYCGGTYCNNHRLPPSHNCINEASWRNRTSSSKNNNDHIGMKSTQPIKECFFCGVETSKIFYCPSCGHDFCEKHKLHKDHYGVQDETKQPKSKPLKPTSSGSSIFKKPYFIFAFLFVIAGVLTLPFFVFNTYSETMESLRITNVKFSVSEYNDLRITYLDKPPEVSTITTGDISFNIENTGFYEENVTTYRVSAVAYDIDYPICSADSDGKIVKPGEIETMHIHCVSSRQPGEHNSTRKESRVVVNIVRKEAAGGTSQTVSTKSTPSPTPLTSIPTTAITLEITNSIIPTKPNITTIPSLAITPEKTQIQISESALKARIQEAKNTLDMLKESDKAETMVYAKPERYGCDFKKSKELGCAIDSNSADMFYVKGDYGRIASYLFENNMTKGHTYVILHTHSGDWERCSYEDHTSSGTSYNTFSIADLLVASDLTKQGYHIQKMIAVSDTNYEVYPKTTDGWKTEEDVYKAIARIEQRMDVKFNFIDSSGKTVYSVDSLMPLLTKELDYFYIAKGDVVSY